MTKREEDIEYCFHPNNIKALGMDVLYNALENINTGETEQNKKEFVFDFIQHLKKHNLRIKMINHA